MTTNNLRFLSYLFALVAFSYAPECHDFNFDDSASGFSCAPIKNYVHNTPYGGLSIIIYDGEYSQKIPLKEENEKYILMHNGARVYALNKSGLLYLDRRVKLQKAFNLVGPYFVVADYNSQDGTYNLHIFEGRKYNIFHIFEGTKYRMLSIGINDSLYPTRNDLAVLKNCALD